MGDDGFTEMCGADCTGPLQSVLFFYDLITAVSPLTDLYLQRTSLSDTIFTVPYKETHFVYYAAHIITQPPIPIVLTLVNGLN